jgi:hypothetical protein
LARRNWRDHDCLSLRAADLGTEGLERDLALVTKVVRQIHDRHPAGADFALDSVTVGNRV